MSAESSVGVATNAPGHAATTDARAPTVSQGDSALAAAPLDARTQTPRDVEVEVQESSGREPLAGARVWLRHPEMSDEPDAVEVKRLGWPAYLAAWATPYVVGADGRVRIAGVVGTPQLVATWEHLLGAVRAPLNDGGFTSIRLSPSFEPELCIVDALGAPAIGAELRYSNAARPERNFELSLTQPRYPLANHVDIARGHDVRLRVTPFGGTAQEFQLDKRFLVEEPTTLVLANTGQLEIRVAGLPPSGPLPHAMKFEVGLATEQASSRGRGERAFGRSFAGRTYHGTLVDGSAICAAISPGLELVVGVDAPGMIGPRPTVRCSGPARAGDVAIVDVPIAAWAVIGGRALDGDGRAITSSSLRVEWDGGWAIETDAAGRFAVPISRTAGESDTRVLEFRHRSGRAVVELPPLHAGDVDLGDVVLASATTLASGRVVGSDQRPIAHATVRARVENATIASTMTNGDGRFELRAFAPHPRFQIWAEHETHLPAGVDAELGARDIVLALDRGATLSVSVLVDGPQVGALIVGLKYADADRAGEGVGWEDEPSDGSVPSSFGPRERTYSFTGLAPGVYALDVRLAGDRPGHRAQLASEHSRIALALGEQRTVEVDLRGVVTTVRVRVLADDGTALPGATVNGADADEYGRVRVSTSSPQPEVEVRCYGWLTRRAVLPAEDREHEIRLERSPSVRFAWSIPDLEGDDEFVWRAVDAANPTLLGCIGSSRTAPDPWLPARAGRFAIRAELRHRNGRGFGVALDPPVEVSIAAGDAPRTIQLRITQAALDAARVQRDAQK